MIRRTYAKFSVKRQNSRRLRRGFAALVLLLLVMAVGPQAVAQGPAAITLQVREYGTGTPITSFTYLVNEDNTGDPLDPDPNLHPSLKPMASHSPVVVTGDQSTATLSLADGRYLVSVRADGYKLGGKHVRLPDDSGTVVVELVPGPLPLSTLRVHVFEDNHPVNGENDIPVESGLSGFNIVVEDTAGEVTVDWFGNPICTRYDGNPGGSTPLGNPIPGSGGNCLTDDNGDVVIQNLPRGKYEVIAVPPNGTPWVQTTTIEGTHVLDAWLEEGSSGYSPREGFQTPAVWIGFVRPRLWPAPGTGTIRGRVLTTVEWTPPVNPLVLGQPVDRPYIGVTDIGGNDDMAFLARGNPDGTFEIPFVPPGVYQLAFWDEPLDYIMSFRTVTISAGQTVDLGDLGIPRWFGWLSGHVFQDYDEDGVRDPGEPGIPAFDLDTRFRDGTIQYTTFTDNDGYYEFPEVFELEKFAVAEVGFGRLGITGASVHNEYDLSQIDATYEGVLTLNELTWAAKRRVIDWGKRNYGPGENGGISGIVFYATTRNEFNARYAAAEDYEPGIPNVTVRLYDATGSVLLNEVQTDAWEHPTGCDVRDSAGNPLPDPLGLGPKCIEVPNISNEVREGVFDGGYAVESYWSPSYGAPGAVEVPGLPAGDYVVEVVVPPGYQILKEEDLNTAEGNNLVPALPPPACVGSLHLADVPDEYGSPYDGQMMPLCDRRLVTVQDGQNAAADFFLFTDNAVPLPGRIFGFLLDDVNVETDPSFIYYGEKRGIPNTPVGIRDFTGRLITTLQSDENGIFEVLLPSTYVADCPIPSGVCPAIYHVVGNDPGDPANPNPNYNPNYQTITFTFDVWPGKTTFADVALFPITAFVSFPGSQFGQPAECTLPAGTPQIQAVSQPYVNNSGSFTITGAGFGAAQGSGSVTIDGAPLAVNSWSDTQITATVPPGFAKGPGQLLVTGDNGLTSPTGLTFHVLGGSYQPTVVTVNPPANPTDTPIQDAINAASGDTLIVVNAGTYYESVTLDRPVKLQGVGPGADDGFGTGGSVLDLRFILTATSVNVVGDPGEFTDGFNAQIDGFRITGARDEQDVGGGVHADLNAQYLQISNNVIQSNGGNFGGGITLGEPYRGDNNNDNVRIVYNRVLNNGGISLAGGIGIFNGANNYEIGYNHICGNYSAEYGGGISHFGLSPGGAIHHNKIYYNNAFDEGGGIIIAGEQPIPNPEEPGQNPPLTEGSGSVTINNNLIQANMSNDDGGGIRLLRPRDFPINIINNIIVNNVATDFGGGISLDDASNVSIVNNTVAKNVGTSTAEDSDGLPHAAGLASEANSAAFQASLPAGSPDFSDPVMFNNIFWDNQAYTWDGTTLVFDSIIDLEVFGTPTTEYLSPTYSILSVPYGPGDPSNTVGVDPQFVQSYNTDLNAVAFRQEPNFISVVMVTVNLPPELQGDYHVTPASGGGGSPAIDAGAIAADGVSAPCVDYDDEERWTGTNFDIGADEISGTPSGQCGGQAPVGPSLQLSTAAAQEGAPGDTLTFVHTVRNTGPNPDSFSVTASLPGWTIQVNPPSVGPLNPGQSDLVSVVVDIPAGATDGTVSIPVVATSQTNSAVSETVTDTVTVVVPPPGAVIPAADFYLSLSGNGTYSVGSVTGVRDEDILGFTGTGFVMVFDGSDVGVGGLDLDALFVLDPSTILISFQSPGSVPGITGTVDDSDIVKFSATSWGDTTAGTFSLFLRGADVGLATNGEAIDAISLLDADQLLISTVGAVLVPSNTTVSGSPPVFGADEDLLLFQMQDPTNPAAGGTWSIYFDGSDVGLGNTGSEDVNGVMDGADGVLHLTTVGNFNVPGISGADEDIFTCTPSSLGANTACTYAPTLYFDGSNYGLTNNGLDAIALP